MFKGFIVSVSLICGVAHAQNLPIEDDLMKLMSLEVETTSAMKRPQSIDGTPASIFVLERRDIELSGYTRLPQLLKLLLGVDARRIDNNQWAISVRSAASSFNSNVLVMIDGQNVSDPIVNGISWEALNYPVDDIERIELVRGPSGSLWGNSSNNGLLNIITRHATDTHGMLVKASVGNDVEQVVELRYGREIDDISSVRVFGGYIRGGESHAKETLGIVIPPNDYTDSHHLGAQYDLQYAEKSAFKAQILQRKNSSGIVERLTNPSTNRLYYKNGQSFSRHTSYNLRADHSFDSGLKLYSQLYGNNVNWGVNNSDNSQRVIAFNTAVNYQWQQHLLSFGGDYVSSEGDFPDNSLNVRLSAINRGVFVQDELKLFDDQLKLIAGVRWDYMGLMSHWENSPSIRANYQFDGAHSIWGAFSKGYRMLINTDQEMEFSAPFPNDINTTPLLLRANSKNAIDYSVTSELGYRFVEDDFNINISAFHSDLDSIFIGKITGEIINGVPTVVNTLVNEGQATSYGYDVAIGWQVSRAFNALIGFSYLDYDLDELSYLEVNVTSQDYDNSQFYTRFQWSPHEDISVQLLAKFVDEHHWFETPAYELVDISVNWHLQDKLILSLVGQNLTNDEFVEFPRDSELFTTSSAIGRMLNLTIKYEF